MLAKTVNNGVLLFDGSLTSGTIDTPVQRLREILSYARRNNSTVLAFSKATTLRANGILITEQLPNHDPPYLLETTGLHSKPPIILLGDVYVARLNKANFAFRLDIDKETPVEQRMDALQKLFGNDLYTQSYPETLRLSHILCTFTANEVLAIKHFITRKHGIQIINRPDMHRLLFGPFGTGRNLLMKLYKKEGNILQIISFPTESAEKGDYLLVEDQDAAKALIAQVIDVQFAAVPGVLEELLRTLARWRRTLAGRRHRPHGNCSSHHLHSRCQSADLQDKGNFGK